MNRRVAVTGIGLVTPLGIGCEAFQRNLFDGRCGIGSIRGFDASSFRSHLAAEILDFRPMDFIAPRTFRRMDRLSQMVTAAARMAIDDAGVDLAAADRSRAGIVMGTAFGATDVVTQFATTLFTEGPRRANPILVPNTVMNAPAGHAAIELGLHGVNTTVNHREASAETAIAYAAGQIRQGRADMLLAGGGDILSPFFFTVMERFRAFSPRDGGEERARPLDRARNGAVAGEGVGLLCLESLSVARARGATIYCEVAGWGMGSMPAAANDWPDDSSVLVRVMDQAVAMAGLTPDAVAMVQASASGGIRSDRLEARALTQFFSGADFPAVAAVKGALGENFASGGIRAAALALSLKSGVVPPTLGVSAPIIPAAAVCADARRMPLDCGLVNACASGGTVVSLLLRRPA